MVSPRAPALLFILPILAVTVLVASVFVVSGERTIVSALVLGGPTDSAGGVFRGRLRATSESRGVATPLARQVVRVVSEQGKSSEAIRLVTDDEGWVEFALRRDPKEVLKLEVRDAGGKRLVHGAPNLSTARWQAAARRRGGGGVVHRSGSLSAQLIVERAVLGVPFESDMRVHVEREERAVSGAEVHLQGDGVDLVSAQGGTTDTAGDLSFKVRPTQHVAALQVSVKHGETRLETRQNLPVVPGSFSYQWEGNRLKVTTPVVREGVWFTLVTETERLAGGHINLEPNDLGGAHGSVEMPHSTLQNGTYLVLASEADGRSPSTVGFPLSGQPQTFDVWDAYLLDGSQGARAIAARADARARWLLGVYAGIAGLLTLVLFTLRIRSADRQLAKSLERAGAEDGVRDESAAPLLIAVVCLFFAFSLGVLWIVAR